MRTTLKYASLAAAIMTATSAQAELQAIDDADMAEVSGQSGIVIEAGFGSIGGIDRSAENAYTASTTLADGSVVEQSGTLGDFYGADWSNAGITIEAFKYIVDIEGGWDQETNTGVNTRLQPLQSVLTEKPLAGIIVKDIAVAGRMDVTIDATADLANVVANGGDVAEGDGGIGITFSDSDINFKMGDMGVFVEPYEGIGVIGGQVSSFGGVEMLGINIDNLGLVIRGNGL
ncbi:DUF6160 family protein [Allohahella marinimesophila]|uniref:DUF6160 domain-containing protein n=1 Tax=Allohahella marinimesophila TaxID=1054972 RepID=A0ABP7NH60_9GAMM